jgi:hypothetical protein
MPQADQVGYLGHNSSEVTTEDINPYTVDVKRCEN